MARHSPVKTTALHGSSDTWIGLLRSGRSVHVRLRWRRTFQPANGSGAASPEGVGCISALSSVIEDACRIEVSATNLDFEPE